VPVVPSTTVHQNVHLWEPRAQTADSHQEAA
jgi:hypothetical protein